MFGVEESLRRNSSTLNGVGGTLTWRHLTPRSAHSYTPTRTGARSQQFTRISRNFLASRSGGRSLHHSVLPDAPGHTIVRSIFTFEVFRFLYRFVIVTIDVSAVLTVTVYGTADSRGIIRDPSKNLKSPSHLSLSNFGCGDRRPFCLNNHRRAPVELRFSGQVQHRSVFENRWNNKQLKTIFLRAPIFFFFYITSKTSRVPVVVESLDLDPLTRRTRLPVVGVCVLPVCKYTGLRAFAGWKI